MMTPPRAASQNLLAERAFWPSWQRFWTAGCRLAVERRETLHVEIDGSRHVAELRTLSQGGTRTPQVLARLAVPTSLRLSDGDRWAGNIDKRGWARALTLEWYSRRTHLWWYQTFQLKGALTYVTVSETRRPHALKQSGMAFT
ncbi:type II secretion system protein [Levilactobacillus acidifarinae]|nr:type II secretion system protein [Levilactobacillus acidifarinae]